MKYYAVITAKNEAETIGGIVNSLVADKWQVIVINDGSSDDTALNAISAGAHVISQSPSIGIGRSLQRAWRVADDDGADYIRQLDAGGSHDPRQARDLLGALIVENADMVIGSRFMPGGKYIGRKWRSFFSRLAAMMLNFATHKQFTDWTSGYRCFSRAEIEKLLEIRYYQTMHAWQIEVLGKAIENNFNIIEVPITYTAGESSLNVGGISDAIMEWLWLLNR